MDEHLTHSMRSLLEDEIIPQLENELDFDPTPQYLWDDTCGEPPVTLDEMHTAAHNSKYKKFPQFPGSMHYGSKDSK